MGRDFLAEILDHKKEEVRAGKRRIAEAQLVQQCREPRDVRGFESALAQPGPVRIIAEIKRASPSKGEICPDLDAAAMAEKYAQGGAAALSVLTDARYFKGSMQDLTAARKACRLPVLRKEFILSAYQIYEAAVAGADAVLLIVRILSAQQLKDYIALCDELRIDALVEVHGHAEVEVAQKAGARIVGINNRDLQTFQTDVHRAMEIARLLTDDQIAVAASGISGPGDIADYDGSRVRSFLIGESLVRSQDPVRFLKQLINAGAPHT